MPVFKYVTMAPSGKMFSRIFAGSFWILVLSRTIGGIASGNLSVATAAIADVTSRKDRSKGMAVVADFDPN